MRKIIVTPAGRRRYLEILVEYLKSYRNEFDRWDIWLNTTDINDIEYIKSLDCEYDFIRVIGSKIPFNGSYSIYHFFKDYKDPNEVYIRLDDDIVYISKGSLERLFTTREKDTESFLLYGNIINNSILTHLHQRCGYISTNNGRADYNCMCRVGWQDPIFAENIHREVLQKLPVKSFKINDWHLYYNERVSINVISWRGDEFLKFDANVGEDEEQWLSVDYPASIGKINKIIGDTLFVHYAFYTQRPHLETTDILKKYQELAQTMSMKTGGDVGN